MSACRILQKHFSEAERQEGGQPVLSLFALTSKMNRGQAARIFYQVCGKFFCLSLQKCMSLFA